MSSDDAWNRRLDDLKQRKRLRTEALLAADLGVSAVVLAQARMGKQPLPIRARLRLLDLLGYCMTRDVVLELLPADVQELVKEIDQRRPVAKARKAKAADPTAAASGVAPKKVTAT